MPCFRGIEMAIVATDDNSIFPEFPHPDGSSARFNRTNAAKTKNAVFESPRPWGKEGNGSPEQTPKADPKISVYIPSAPNTSFFLGYSIHQPPAEHRFLFFKTFINGHQIAAWGLDLDTAASGVTKHALFEPSEYYQYNDNGVVMKEPGIESRCFRFVSHGGSGGGCKDADAMASVADDGGLIEVRVFRARARRQQAVRLPHLHDSGKYGIALVSNGLLEKPHLAKYYKYLLADAKDAPFASFLFHYRTWENLQMLQLAPSERPEFLCSPSPKTPVKRKARQKKDGDSQSPETSPARPLPPVPPQPRFTSSAELFLKGDRPEKEKKKERCSLLFDDDDYDVFGPEEDKSQSTGFILFPFTDDLCKKQV